MEPAVTTSSPRSALVEGNINGSDRISLYWESQPNGRRNLMQAVRQAVQKFVDRTLGGTVAPFVAYLAERETLSDEEIKDLEALVARLQKERRGKP